MTTLETNPIAFFFSPLSPGAEPAEASGTLGAGLLRSPINLLPWYAWGGNLTCLTVRL